jgi:hypothetical protein
MEPEPPRAPAPPREQGPRRPLTEREPAKVANLIDYLGNLSKYLPEDKKQAFMAENIPLKMEQIRHKLSGAAAERASPWPVKGEAASATREKLRAIMERLKVKLSE